ncbi:MAG TPA: tyrosine-type recombinase/integrase [Conexibacter sp.]|jgi:site-specific recombinase XerD|nr:tyrosine-type recombinase/integrase [Conexibacter sp.]
MYASSYSLHAAQALDDVPLDELNVACLRRWQGDLLKAGTSAHAIIKTRTFLSSVLTHAAESDAIPSNSLRVVRPPKKPETEPVRPLAPITVETIRGILLGAMATSLPARIRNGGTRARHMRRAYDVPDARSHKKTWGKACRRAELTRVPRPYDLRHSFASLLLAGGKTVHYVARQLGHSPSLTLETYGHIIEEYEDSPPIDPEAEIREARATLVAQGLHSEAG